MYVCRVEIMCASNTGNSALCPCNHWQLVRGAGVLNNHDPCVLIKIQLLLAPEFYRGNLSLYKNEYF